MIHNDTKLYYIINYSIDNVDINTKNKNNADEILGDFHITTPDISISFLLSLVNYLSCVLIHKTLELKEDALSF